MGEQDASFFPHDWWVKFQNVMMIEMHVCCGMDLPFDTEEEQIIAYLCILLFCECFKSFSEMYHNLGVCECVSTIGNSHLKSTHRSCSKEARPRAKCANGNVKNWNITLHAGIITIIMEVQILHAQLSHSMRTRNRIFLRFSFIFVVIVFFC